ncbi:ectoine/hydroxyectoine ABC transporter solute-binding protein [Saccharomonospora marina XMU15]|uniref:Ectoine/hydroxyectoine ABC transporter solute-binding protein n=1 Tax=Saccharomonospora marina XMU15 TaxID=882083 RepID=H5X5U2_9PSEU|nr:ectoine/hydroxyectoine ABC transporter substrate-binding protein EhuB [Saccharomonospora marina]EHR52296.1 ectoine/hydroxyectoine ABC transporter solute-binding protein [Saccharomonospora marina XMU15]
MAHGEWTRRDFFRRSAAMGAVALGGPTLLSACQSTGGDGDTLEQARQAGTIRIGIANEAPYGFADSSGKVTGEAPEVARAVFRNMGINGVQNQVVTFDQLIPALNAGQFDVVSAGMFITPERCGQAAFSIPDYTAKTALLVPSGNPQQVNNFDDIAEKNVRVAVLSAAVEKGYAEAAGVPEGNIQTLDTQDSMLRSVVDGRVYCAALTDISLNWLVKQNPNAGVEVTESFDAKDENGQPVISAGGFVFREADESLRTTFNDQLRRLHESGEWLRLAEPFGFTQANLPGNLTTEELCSA